MNTPNTPKSSAPDEATSRRSDRQAVSLRDLERGWKADQQRHQRGLRGTQGFDRDAAEFGSLLSALVARLGVAEFAVVAAAGAALLAFLLLPK